MAWFKSRKGKSELPKASIQDYEEEAKNEFGLKFVGNGWSCEGDIQDGFAAFLDDHEKCLSLLATLREKMQFDKVCVLLGGSSAFVCNSNPPKFIKTGMSNNECAEFVAELIMQSNSNKNPVRFNGAVILGLK